MIELLRATTVSKTQAGLVERDAQRIEQQMAPSLANEAANVKLVVQELVAAVRARVE